MNIPIPKAIVNDPEHGILRCGYGKLSNRRTGETSFTRRLHGDMYPRFHIYINEEAGAWIFSLHLDQKRPSYEGSSAHAGEYAGATVEQEAARIKKTLVGDAELGVE